MTNEQIKLEIFKQYSKVGLEYSPKDFVKAAEVALDLINKDCQAARDLEKVARLDSIGRQIAYTLSRGI